jgi:hypothetical protein
MPSNNVKSVLDKLKENPQHLRALEWVLTMMCNDAKKALSPAEKEELLKELASLAEIKGVTG